MEMRLLEYAVEIYRKRSFTKAALSLCITQPSLSQQIAKLERDLGVRLFFRGHGSIEPTPEGIRFIEQAEQILQMRNDLLREMRERGEGMGRDLVIGTTAITGRHVLPPLLKEYGDRFPNVQIRLVEETTAQLTELTGQGLVDLSILALPIEDSRLTTKTMFSEPLYLALPRIHREWMPEEIRSLIPSDSTTVLPNSLHLHSLAQAPLILLKQGYGFRRTVLELCAKSGFQPTIAYETSSIETAQTLVAYGLGITIVPKMVIQQRSPSTPLYILLEPQSTRTLVFAYHRQRYLSLAAKSFIEIYDQSKEGR